MHRFYFSVHMKFLDMTVELVLSWFIQYFEIVAQLSAEKLLLC